MGNARTCLRFASVLLTLEPCASIYGDDHVSSIGRQAALHSEKEVIPSFREVVCSQVPKNRGIHVIVLKPSELEKPLDMFEPEHSSREGFTYESGVQEFTCESERSISFPEKVRVTFPKGAKAGEKCGVVRERGKPFQTVKGMEASQKYIGHVFYDNKDPLMFACGLVLTVDATTTEKAPTTRDEKYNRAKEVAAADDKNPSFPIRACAAMNYPADARIIITEPTPGLRATAVTWTCELPVREVAKDEEAAIDLRQQYPTGWCWFHADYNKLAVPSAVFDEKAVANRFVVRHKGSLQCAQVVWMDN